MASNPSYIAQTFSVNTGDSVSGVHLSKIDLYFKSKSSTYPVTVQLRKVRDGVPTSEILPFSSVTLEPASVNVSDDSSVATTFTFDVPVLLKNMSNYAILVVVGGNTDDYTVWTSEVTKQDLLSGGTIAKQPAAGIMMISSDGKTFSPLQSEDLKYTMYRAAFTNQNTTVVLDNEDLDFFDINNLTGNMRVGETIRGMSVMTFANNASVPVGTVIKSKHAANNNTINHPFYANGTIRVVSDNGDGTVTASVDALGSFSAATASNTNNLYLGTGIWVGNTSAFSANTKTAVIDTVDQTKLTMVVSESTGGWSANTINYVRGQSSGGSFTISTVKDIQLNSAIPKVPYVGFPRTKEVWSLRTSSSSGVIQPEYENVTLNTDNLFIKEEKAIIGESTPVTPVDGLDKTLVVKGELTSFDTRLSQTIDVNRSLVEAIGNKINNDSTDEHKEIGNAQCRYITRAIEMEDGQEAEDLKVFLTAYKPSGTDVKVYARIQSSTDDGLFSNKDFTPLTQITSISKVSDSVNQDDFLEFEYGFSANTNGQDFLGSSWANNHAYLNTSDEEIVYYRSEDGSFHKDFKTFAIKIVLTSTSTALVPTVKDMRAIALQK